MKRTLSSFLGLLLILCGVSTAAKDRKTPVPDPTLGAIGVTIRVKGPTPMSVSNNVSEVFFVRVEQGADILRAEKVLTGRFSEGNQVYLLNVEPGRYVVVGASYVPGKVGASTFTQRTNVYFNKEMIPATTVTVEAGRITFMGQIAAKEGFTMKNADGAQTYYRDLLGLGMAGTLQGVDRDSKTANEFWKRAVKETFKDEPDWQELARRQLALP